MSTLVVTARTDGFRDTRRADQIFDLGERDDFVGYGSNDLLVSGTENDHLTGDPSADTVWIDGSGASDRWLVATGIAFDDPSVYVFENTRTSSSPVSLLEVGHLDIDGLAGADRLVLEDVFGTWRAVTLGGSTQVTGFDSLTFDGGGGNDTLHGFKANGPLLGRGGAGDDRLIGGSGTDLLLGGAGADVLVGGAGGDTLHGGSGGDVLRGGAGADILNGGGGDDTLVGGNAPDVLRGGGGADLFRYLALPEPPLPNVRLMPERVVDFAQAEGDQIDLAAIDARPDLPGDQAFWFADGINFIVYQPGTVTTYRSSSDTFVTADTGKGVLTVLVQGPVTFTADDFIL